MRRRVQFIGVSALTLVGALAELISIGAVLPFLQMIAAPETLDRMPGAAWVTHRLGSRTEDLLLPFAILLMVTAAIAAAIRILLIWVSSRYIFGLTHDLSMAVYDRVIRQPYTLYIQRNSADVLAGLDKVQYVGAYFLNPLMTALSSIIIAAGIIALLVAVNPFVALITGGSVGLLYGLTTLLTRSALLRAGYAQAELSTQRLKAAQETLGGLRDIILDRSYEAFSWHYRVIDARLRWLAAVINFVSLAPRYLVEGVGMILIAALALYFARQPGGVVQAIPVLGALALSAQRLLPLAQNINLGFVQYAATIGMVKDVLELIHAPVVQNTKLQRDAAPLPFARDITLDDVGFAYEQGRPALEGISFVIPKGARIGVIGRTGSGKSTLLDVLTGLLPTTSGELRIDGQSLDPVRIAAWQAQIAHVPQSIFLLDKSIAANIAFGAPDDDIDLDRVRDAARRADAAEFIEQLPQGYDTSVGERGVRLSGGQRQRIGIARALYKRASVLIFDEATSALDDATERSVMAGIEQLDRDLTILMIAHRLSTVAQCDKVIRLEAGRVIAIGTYQDVVVNAEGEAERISE